MLFRAPEAHSRSFIKAVSWRMLGSIDTFIISYFVTHQLVFAASIASVETVTKVILFYGHERIWAAVPWGRADTVSTPKPGKAAKLRKSGKGGQTDPVSEAVAQSA